jgi:hypothetical protein
MAQKQQAVLLPQTLAVCSFLGGSVFIGKESYQLKRPSSTDAKSLVHIAARIDQRAGELARLRKMEKAVGDILDALEMESGRRSSMTMEAWLGKNAHRAYSRLRAVHDGQVQDLAGAEQMGLTPR